jgi:predicted amino acid racemase
MAYIELYSKKLKNNFLFLSDLFQKNNKSWAIVTKLFCGNRKFINEVLNLGIDEVCDSRISNLKVIKELNPNVKTFYIKPPAKRSIRSIVKYADYSFNTESVTIKMLSDEAVLQNKIHKIIIMIELGDLREGILGEDLEVFYQKVFNYPNIEVEGIGANLYCLNGVLPSQDKLLYLVQYKKELEKKFNKKIRYVSGGSSVVLPYLLEDQVPEELNHFRMGESLFLGTNIIDNSPIAGMYQDVLMLHAEIIEISKKEYSDEEETIPVEKGTIRGILDIGSLDMSLKNITPVDKDVNCLGASSDMVVVDLTNTLKKYKVGDTIAFRINYMGALHLFNSNYIEKVLV